MVRRGVLGLLLLCVPQILGGDAKDGAPRRGESVRDSAVKSFDEDRSRPIRAGSVSDRSSDDVASPLVGDGAGWPRFSRIEHGAMIRLL
jgi:hypothetical protein